MLAAPFVKELGGRKTAAELRDGDLVGRVAASEILGRMAEIFLAPGV
jgi:hypothetical protein